jgi:hypothetical protein
VKHLEFYPEETNGPISEVWQATHWKEFKPSERTPMYGYGLRHFYIEEVCRLTDGQLVMPLAWIKRDGELCADCLLITSAFEVSAIDSESIIVSNSRIQRAVGDL